ncbi:hypothetical protein FB451DRAFT_1213846 [Mycena latifolia]|nr:hypothetical protein FB451DRAFT_1213846 [Mycena latifolia]
MDPSTAYLYLLPAEVWLACWTLCSIRQLRRLSLVCRLFRSLCMPLLLEHQSFDVERLEWGLGQDDWMDRVRHLHRTAVRMDKLAEGPYAILVRSLKVTLRSERSPMTRLHRDIRNIHLFDRLCARIGVSFSATLGVYQNLSSLQIYSFNIDAAFLTTLVSLPQLEALTVRNSEIVAWEGFLNLRSLTASSLQLPEGNEGPLHLASPDTIQILHLDDDDEKSPLIAGFGSSRPSHLVHLSFGSISSGETLVSFLAQCPRLESLSIATSNSPLPSLSAIHPSIVPRLRTLTGPPQLVQALTPNRPVSCVTVLRDHWLDEEDVMPVCMDISRSSSPLHSLSLPRIPPTFEFLDGIISLFPDLSELSMELPGYIAFACGTGRRRTKPKPSIDSRSLELRDEDAFDNLPADELSDAEPDKLPTPILIKAATGAEFPAVPGIHNVLRWLFERRLLLPPAIEVFRLGVDGDLRKLSLEEEHQAIATLSGLYPLLREVQFGWPSTNWQRTGGLWKSEGSEIRVVS